MEGLSREGVHGVRGVRGVLEIRGERGTEGEITEEEGLVAAEFGGSEEEVAVAVAMAELGWFGGEMG